MLNNHVAPRSTLHSLRRRPLSSPVSAFDFRPFFKIVISKGTVVAGVTGYVLRVTVDDMTGHLSRRKESGLSSTYKCVNPEGLVFNALWLSREANKNGGDLRAC